jgi:8-amino-7-oxononanoate synthase
MNDPVLQMTDATHVLWKERNCLFFGGYDYHRLSRHPTILSAIHRTLDSEGLSCSGSRVTTGTHPLHLRFETLMADFLGLPAAVLLPTGYMANLALFEALAWENCHYFFHPDCHPSLRTAMRLSGLPAEALPENVGAGFIREHGKDKKPVIVTDGIYETLPPLQDYYELISRTRGYLIIDEAHSLGVLGKRGRGAAEHCELPANSLILTSSLCKGPGVAGGIVAGPEPLIRNIRKTCTYSTTSSPTLPLTAAAIAALEILISTPEMIGKLQERALSVRKILSETGWPIPLHPGPVLTLYPEAREQSEALYASLRDNGIYPSLIRYFEKPEHFRFALSSAHSDEDVHLLLKALQQTRSGRG